MSSNDRIDKVKRCTLAANNQFFSDHRELFCYFQRPDLDNAIVAWVRLNKADELAGSEPRTELYVKILETAFLTLFDKSVLNPIAELSSLAWDAVEQMRRNTGIGAQSLPAPVKKLTAEEKLEAQIREDWKTLSTKAIKAKVANDPTYRATFERIVDSLQSVATQQVVMR